jgi:hypothetical protein
MPLIDLAQLESLQLGAGPWVVQVSEDTLNLALCAMSTLDDRDEWETDSEELDDAGWAEAIEMLSLAQWELTEEVGVGGEVFVDRGNVAGFDFVIGNFTANGAWQTKDLSAIVTDTDATRVLIVAEIRDGAAGQAILLSDYGDTYHYNRAGAHTQVANVYSDLNCEVGLDAQRRIAYLISSGMDICSMTVRGWWKPAS